MKLVSGLVLLVVFSFASSAPQKLTKDFNDVTISDSETTAEDDTKFINQLLDLLVKKAILDEANARQFLNTFKVAPVNRKADGAPFTKNTIGSWPAKGNPDAHKKFVDRISDLLDKPDKRNIHLIEHLLELVIDNDVLEADPAGELASENGYSIDIKITTTTTTTTESQQHKLKPRPKPEPPKPEPEPEPESPEVTTDVKNVNKPGKPRPKGSPDDSSEDDPKPPKDCSQCMNLATLHRLYNEKTGDHFYTTNLKEAYLAVSQSGYHCEESPGLVSSRGADCKCFKNGFKPVYRLFKKGKQADHFYTLSKTEADKATRKSGYKYEGIAFYCATEQANKCGASAGFLRFWTGAEHFYTTDAEEGKRIGLANRGKAEGITCYIWPSNYEENICKK